MAAVKYYGKRVHKVIRAKQIKPQLTCSETAVTAELKVISCAAIYMIYEGDE